MLPSLHKNKSCNREGLDTEASQLYLLDVPRRGHMDSSWVHYSRDQGVVVLQGHLQVV